MVTQRILTEALVDFPRADRRRGGGDHPPRKVHGRFSSDPTVVIQGGGEGSGVFELDDDGDDVDDDDDDAADSDGSGRGDGAAGRGPFSGVLPAGTSGVRVAALDRRISAFFGEVPSLELGVNLAVRVYHRRRRGGRSAGGGSSFFVALRVPCLVTDRFGVTVLVRDLLALYQGRGPVTRPPVDYVDYVHWHYGHLATENGERLHQFWREHLGSGDLPLLEMPPDAGAVPLPAAVRDAPPGAGPPCAAVPIRLNKTVNRQLDALCRKHAVAKRALLYAVWVTLLHRYTGQEDMVVGLLIRGRRQKDTRVCV